MATELITSRIWHRLTKEVKRTTSKSLVAVAYFGKGGAKMLPLKSGSQLLVDISEKAVKAGQTCPAELLDLYYKGVRIYSLPALHAKMFVIGRNLFIGSTNVSGNSSFILQEAIMKTSERQIVEDAKTFIRQKCIIDLGDDYLKRMQKLYRPPVFPLDEGRPFIRSKGVKSNSPSFLIYQLEKTSYTEQEQEESEKGKTEAHKKRVNKSRHKVDELMWTDSLAAKQGDTILQITNEGTDTLVSPPGRLIHVREWSNGAKPIYFCYVEIPLKRRKNIKTVKKQLNKSERIAIDKNGRRNKKLAEKIISLWN